MSALRRNARLRREYMFRKGLDGKERILYEKKRKIKEALSEGKPIPTELKAEAAELKRLIDLDDPSVQGTTTHIDDEYAKAGIQDPKLLITTSRDASSRLTQFVKELRLVFPNSQRINRGKTVTKEIVEAARANDFTDIILVHEHRGEPDGMIISHLPFGPTAFFGITNCVLRHDLTTSIAPVSEAFPHLIFHNFASTLGSRLQNVLRFLFPVPKPDSRRVMTFANRGDVISFRQHVYKKTGHREIELSEVGPRFEMKLYQLRLGTLEQGEAENEWVLRPYMNTAKKRKVL